MTVSSSTDRATFLGNGVAQIFPLPFRFFANSEIQAWLVTNSTGALTVLSLGTHYTLSGAGDPEVDGNPTSELTMLTAPTALQSLFVQRVIPATQPTDIVNQGRFFPEIHENVFDRLTMLMQQVGGEAEGAIRVAVGDPEPSRLVPAAQRANFLMAFDSQGNPIAVAPANGSASDLAMNLANTSDPAKGAGQIGRGGQVVSSIAGLRALFKTSASKNAFVAGYYAAGDGGGGPYYLDAADTTSADNGGTVIVADDGGRWKLATTGAITMRQFGASQSIADNTAFINGAITYCAAANIELVIDGQFTVTGTVLIRDFLRLSGFGPDNSKIIVNTTDGTYGVAANGGVAQRVDFSNFGIQGGTTTKSLFNAEGVRYSSFRNVHLMNYTKGLRLHLAWGNRFYSCSFKAGHDTGTRPAGSIGVDMVQGGAVNAISFIACVLSYNEVAVKAAGAGRDIVFEGACTFESNRTCHQFAGSGSSKAYIVRNCYFEANTTHHFFIDRGVSRDDQITVERNYFDITPGIFAGVMAFSGAASGTSSINLIDNHIEQLVADSNPVNPFVLYFSEISTGVHINYQSHVSFIVTGANAVKIGHFNQANIDYRRFSSNIPYVPAYRTNAAAPNNPFVPRDANEKALIYVDNGKATLVGTVQDTGNTFVGFIDILDIPFTLSPKGANYPLPCLQMNGTGNPTMANASVTGTTIEAYFADADGYIALNGSWPLQLSAYA